MATRKETAQATPGLIAAAIFIAVMVALDEHYSHVFTPIARKRCCAKSSIVQAVVSLDEAGGLGMGSPYSSALFAANFR
ncbi:hypothetical protein ABIC03_007066 [Bradyrhizobium sp. RT6a]|uniref:hypothetical protein n=1 Tax=Bradyrhizobium sp. RT6a TaxID=3156381 RepID=UPI003390FF43